MSSLGLLLVLSAALAATLALILAVVALPWRAATASLLIVLGLAALVLVAEAQLPGTPRAVDPRAVPEAEVHYARVDRPRRILLVLSWAGLLEPRYVEIPWTEALEHALRQGQAEAIVRRRPLRVRLAGAARAAADHEGGPPGDQGPPDAVFYAAPPPALPPKS